MTIIRVGTRSSKLAIAQARPMIDHLRNQGLEIEWREFTTSGDKWLAGPLDERGGSGFFTKELEASLLDREVVTGVETAFTMVLIGAGLVAGLLLANVLVPERRMA